MITVGHSLGAALSMIYALDMSTRNVTNNIEAITLGQPAVGDLAYTQYFSQQNITYTRIVTRFQGNFITYEDICATASEYFKFKLIKNSGND